MRRAQVPCYGIRGAMAYPQLGGLAAIACLTTVVAVASRGSKFCYRICYPTPWHETELGSTSPQPRLRLKPENIDQVGRDSTNRHDQSRSCYALSCRRKWASQQPRKVRQCAR
jgi:hypothetical protein